MVGCFRKCQNLNVNKHLTRYNRCWRYSFASSRLLSAITRIAATKEGFIQQNLGWMFALQAIIYQLLASDQGMFCSHPFILVTYHSPAYSLHINLYNSTSSNYQGGSHATLRRFHNPDTPIHIGRRTKPCFFLPGPDSLDVFIS